MKKQLLILLSLPLLLSACGPDLAGLKPDNPLPDDGTLQLAQPEIQQQQAQQQQQLTQEQQMQLQQQQAQQQAQQQQMQQPPQQPQAQPTEEPADFPQKPDIPNVSTATIKTSKGDIVIQLYADKAPKTVKNFNDKSGSGFYEGLKFHRVEDWVIQGGDPKGDGTGGGTMDTEINSQSFTEGSVGVARGGDIKISNDSQFFICTTDCSWLNNQYTNFGEVTEGMEIAKQIAIGDTIESISVE